MTMPTNSPAAIEQVIERLTDMADFCDGGTRPHPANVARLCRIAAKALTKSEPIVSDAIEAARQRATVLFNGYALGVSMQHKRGEEQFRHDVETFSNELAEALRPLAMARAQTLSGGEG